MKSVRIVIASFAGLLASAANAQFVLTGTSYLQDFNSLADGLADGWSVRTGATTSNLGSVASFGGSPTTWSNATGAFKNLASATGLASGASTAVQNSAADRALGVRQTGTFGDPGAAFVFNFNSLGLQLASLELDLMVLSHQGRSTTWTIDYGLGATPATFTTLTTWTDPGAFGTTSLTLGSLGGLSDQGSVWLRIAALDTASGTGTRDTIGLDNFSVTYSTPDFAAVPEPATTATVLSLLVLGAAVARRTWSRARKQNTRPIEAGAS